MLQVQLRDNVKSRLINSQPINLYRTPAPGEKPMRSQFYLYDYFKEMAERK